ncbi:MAG: hypothetical protein Tp1123DCM1511741_55 [Prokaryotic dsDNA virus sp.]|nr:MAG: hypothetical protein Tp1123DCM1511741_55 [Prokaryotic dsDNA virus sp.]|tara:strand:+ start:61 stop:276 length:216 start_codon:yes stop_codon:yes gene_type:complete
MDIKTIAGLVGLVITLGGIMVQIGSVMNRIEVLESQSFPDVKQMSINDARIQVLESRINEMKARSDNPLIQ